MWALKLKSESKITLTLSSKELADPDYFTPFLFLIWGWLKGFMFFPHKALGNDCPSMYLLLIDIKWWSASLIWLSRNVQLCIIWVTMETFCSRIMSTSGSKKSKYMWNKQIFHFSSHLCMLKFKWFWYVWFYWVSRKLWKNGMTHNDWQLDQDWSSACRQAWSGRKWWHYVHLYILSLINTLFHCPEMAHKSMKAALTR